MLDLGMLFKLENTSYLKFQIEIINGLSAFSGPVTRTVKAYIVYYILLYIILVLMELNTNKMQIIKIIENVVYCFIVKNVFATVHILRQTQIFLKMPNNAHICLEFQ